MFMNNGVAAMDLGKKKSFVPDGRSEIGRRIILAGMLHHVDNVQSMPHEVDSHLHQCILIKISNF